MSSAGSIGTAPWRQYVYHPNPGTIYEETCMGEISKFIRDKTTEHRQAKTR